MGIECLVPHNASISLLKRMALGQFFSIFLLFNFKWISPCDHLFEGSDKRFLVNEHYREKNKSASMAYVWCSITGEWSSLSEPLSIYKMVAEVIWACWQPVNYLPSFSLTITTLLLETVNISQIIVSGKLHRFFIFIIYYVA